MKRLARNATVFKFSCFGKEQFNEAIEFGKFTPIAGVDERSGGFVPSVMENELAHYVDMGNVGLFAYRVDTKVLPSSVVKAEVAVRVKHIFNNEGRTVGRKERKEIAQIVREELIVKAFTKSVIISGWIDFRDGIIVVDTPSSGKAEEVVVAIFKGLQRTMDETQFTDCKIEAWVTTDSPKSVMTNWLMSDESPDGISIDDRALIVDEEFGARSRLTKQEVARDEVRELLKGDNANVIELGITVNDAVSFVLNQNNIIKRITHLDITPVSGDDEVEIIESEIALNALTIRMVVDKMNMEMGGVRSGK